MIPHARLIIVVRDPVERAHSNWTHLWSAGLDPIDDFVRACAPRTSGSRPAGPDFWHYKRVGLVRPAVEHLYSVFPREQVLVFRYRDLVEDPPGTLDRICGFLGVGQGVIDHLPRENVTAHPEQTRRHQYTSRHAAGSHRRSRRDCPVIRAGYHRPAGEQPPAGRGAASAADWAERQALLPYFEADIRLLEELTGEDYSHWLQAARGLRRPRRRQAGGPAAGAQRPTARLLARARDLPQAPTR